MDATRRVDRAADLQPRWPDRLATAALGRRRGGRCSRNFRRALAALLLITAGLLALIGDPVQPPGTRVLAVSRDLPTGATIGPSDLVVVSLNAIPDGALRTAAQAVGRVLSSPVRRGEILTDLRLVTSGRPDPGPGRVAVPVRPADPGTVDLLTPGVHVAVLAVAQNGQATLLAPDAVVLTIPPASKDRTTRLVVLAVPTATADRITAAGVVGTVALRFATA
ncbi:SAF domain-containing protein [Nakamurella sp. PAMC28650]|uniref:SAF domain-containing protein n=1 Tax=Nakamurella sp. PAMC28650 TaxID=2762325 RepID=UPI00164D6FB0|nr:SAF domain-containing protein [Nakamurella sp. PAMC28650]QNK81108.1 Flp pilus assembly protein CpaB [Nakamurella sp. PAMC28650]